MAKTRFEKAMDKISGAAVTELPAVTADDEGDVLKVNAQGEWDKGEIALELPEVTADDAGKVLMVDENGNWVAAEISGENSGGK